ncbi:M24 family metallopeptidase [Hoeflea sp. G2-23]|uniref:M24 family metallopeptidase n=1 Tax=Hoeflea algicola TaxID=2983763 RepID=A0ABT3ZF36_9HYPH|nr:aminopeptidase P family protein [Hoeflea algicola]MCY0150420.1 M24 family metallopeptidase [Hoeflea algicola]
MSKPIRLIETEWPDYDAAPLPAVRDAAVYRRRLQATRERMELVGLDTLVVYADREHFGTMVWLTGFDPRFEEALLVLSKDRLPLFIVGNECENYLGASPMFAVGEIRHERYQPFSLISQPRADSRQLAEILAGEGIGSGSRVGVAGWKYFTEGEHPDPAHAIEAPSFIADTLRALAGYDAVTNQTAMFMNPLDGLRTIADADDIALFEHANSVVSRSVRAMIFAMREGMSDFEVLQAAGMNGMPLGCHPTFCTDDSAPLGLAGPSGNTLQLGQPLSFNMCVWRANCCRAGWLAHGANDLPEPSRDYVEAFAGPYVQALDRWFSMMRPGVSGGAVKAEIDRLLPFEKFGVFLNPGHLIDTDEWLSSPIFEGSQMPLRSGHVMQVDIIPSSPVYFSTRMEDTIVIADDSLRADLKARHPDVHARITARTSFMRDVMGFDVPDSMLPLSDMAGIAPPFLFSPEKLIALG